MADICQCRRQTNWQLLAGRVMTVAIWETNKLRHDYYSYKQVCFNVINYPDTGGPAPACIGIPMHLTRNCSSIYLIVFLSFFFFWLLLLSLPCLVDSTNNVCIVAEHDISFSLKKKKKPLTIDLVWGKLNQSCNDRVVDIIMLMEKIHLRQGRLRCHHSPSKDDPLN